LLEVQDIHVAYGQVRVLFGLSLKVRPGEILCLLGRNGAGKTTTLKSIMNHLPLRSGTITLDGDVISELRPEQIPRCRIGYVPQGRRLFSELTVAENLEIGLMTNRSGQAVRDRILSIFPRLRERLRQQASTLSGGEQQMLAFGRALCLEPRVLLLDEPTEGLQPSMIRFIRQIVLRMKQENVAIILVEQRLDAVLSIADRVAIIEDGRNRETLTISELKRNQESVFHYLGV